MEAGLLVKVLKMTKDSHVTESLRSCFKTEESLLSAEGNGVVVVGNGVVFLREVFLPHCCITSTPMISLY